MPGVAHRERLARRRHHREEQQRLLLARAGPLDGAAERASHREALGVAPEGLVVAARGEAALVHPGDDHRGEVPAHRVARLDDLHRAAVRPTAGPERADPREVEHQLAELARAHPALAPCRLRHRGQVAQELGGRGDATLVAGEGAEDGVGPGVEARARHDGARLLEEASVAAGAQGDELEAGDVLGGGPVLGELPEVAGEGLHRGEHRDARPALAGAHAELGQARIEEALDVHRPERVGHAPGGRLVAARGVALEHSERPQHVLALAAARHHAGEAEQRARHR